MALLPTVSNALVPVSVIAASPLMQPRMMYSGGCAGSSATMLMAMALLNIFQPAGKKTVFMNSMSKQGGQELTKCIVNSECTMRPNGGQEQAVDSTAMLRSVQRYATETDTNSTLVFKAAEIAFNQEIADALHKVNAQAMAVYRGNTLDQVICQVRDCFEVSDDVGMPVNATTGERSDICFKRRKLSRDDQPIVWLNVSTLRKHLDKRTRRNHEVGAKMRSYGWADAAVSTTEELLRYVEDTSAASLEASVAAWGRVMHSWRVDHNVSAIRAFLANQDSRGAYPPQPQPLSNRDEVHKALRGWGPSYAGMFR